MYGVLNGTGLKNPNLFLQTLNGKKEIVLISQGKNQSGRSVHEPATKFLINA